MNHKFNEFADEENVDRNQLKAEFVENVEQTKAHYDLHLLL